ncbi:hypothetical protein [Gluconobacter morbifer]|uniref:Phosphate starvation-inducible protein PsiF n=1 Tax=Gluconobacter morbifer G707 TaxID=1088869 RepID=G6XF91_9PROT|nr:hypothetical protein [Gluconobacter morbifer]EHH68849.1 hypothetical protein GMO_01560 [Gluconobacter morbifer G707]
MKHSLIALTCLSFVLASGASAATREEQKDACQGDALRLCTLAIPNEAKITACMKKKIDKLSPRCRAMFKPLPQPKKTEDKKS